jgi:hypothetical protein
MYALVLVELLDALWQRLDQPETAERLYGFVLRYYAVNLEGYLNVRHPARASSARASLDAMGRALGDLAIGAPPSPEAFDQQRRRLRRVLDEAMPRR